MVTSIKNYSSKLNLIETEKAIKFVKDTFENELAKKLNLIRVSAPLFVIKESGLNDDLNGVERPVSFDISCIDKNVEIVQSLAKWKRNALHQYDFAMHSGLYTDMNAIRRDENVDNIHSVYVDQWDWEKIIKKSERNLQTLKKVVNTIYKVLLNTEKKVNKKFPILDSKLAPEIVFISSQELLDMYPTLPSKSREYEAVKKYGSVFIYQIGWPLSDGIPHDLRAADYDDWNLNGDIIVYDKQMDIALELSSMGIRVDTTALIKQSESKNEKDKLNTPYSSDILNERLPFTIGGGIGQSRICLFYLEKMHIGEVQASIWPQDDITMLAKKGIKLL